MLAATGFATSLAVNLKHMGRAYSTNTLKTNFKKNLPELEKTNAQTSLCRDPYMVEQIKNVNNCMLKATMGFLSNKEVPLNNATCHMLNAGQHFLKVKDCGINHWQTILKR